MPCHGEASAGSVTAEVTEIEYSLEPDFSGIPHVRNLVSYKAVPGTLALNIQDFPGCSQPAVQVFQASDCTFRQNVIFVEPLNDENRPDLRFGLLFWQNIFYSS